MQVGVGVVTAVIALGATYVGGWEARKGAREQTARQEQRDDAEIRAQERGAARLLQEEFAERAINIRAALGRKPPRFSREQLQLSFEVPADDRRAVAARLKDDQWKTVALAAVYVARFNRLLTRERGKHIGPRNKKALEGYRRLFFNAARALQNVSGVRANVLTETLPG